MTVSEMKPHILGIAALSAALVILGYTANTASVRRVATLPTGTSAVAQQAPTWSQPSPIEPTKAQSPAQSTAEPSTQKQMTAESTGQKLKDQIRAMLPSVGSTAAQKDATNWSAEDWQIAEKAVADHRNSANSKNDSNKSANASGRSDLVWQPPQEIR
ncbi:MAG: hypothetical protein WAK01_08450 [Methylocystis sp.]